MWEGSSNAVPEDVDSNTAVTSILLAYTCRFVHHDQSLISHECIPGDWSFGRQ
jgi:hypothetical protein